jgi:cysteine-rich repeat protein
MSITDGWECPTPGTACNLICGNGVENIHADVPGQRLIHTEECDDDNDTTGDGCDDECAVEDGWECFWPTDSPDPFVDSRDTGTNLTKSFWYKT